MKPRNLVLPILALSGLVACRLAFAAEEVNPATLYELSTAGSSQKVKSGGKGTLVLEIKTKNGSHISGEAPFKIEVTGDHIKPEKDKLTLADSVSKKAVPEGFADPRFEVPFTTEAAGKTAVDAKLTFFICTEKICARQQKTLSVPVEID